MAKRTIRTGVGTYRRAGDDQWTFGTLGEVVEVHEDDLERFDRLNVVPGAVTAVPGDAHSDPGDGEHLTDDEVAEGGIPLDAKAEVAKPARAATKAVWVEYAIAQGVTRDEADALTRDALVEKFGG